VQTVHFPTLSCIQRRDTGRGLPVTVAEQKADLTLTLIYSSSCEVMSRRCKPREVIRLDRLFVFSETQQKFFRGYIKGYV
jgi:hypothetical protein